MNKAVIFMLALFATAGAKSQTQGLGTWNVVNAKMDFTKKWNGFIEGQVRSQKFYNDFFYHELKVGIGYHITTNAQFIIGTGKMETYQYEGNFEFPIRGDETRLWEQLNLDQDFHFFKLQHSYRAEQRFSNSSYRNRFRYRLNANIPISKTRLYVTVYDELFLSEKKPYFERNREYGGFGYKFTPIFSAQLGFIHQYDYNKDINPFTKNSIQTSLLFDLNTLKREEHPQQDNKSFRPVQVSD